MTKKQLRHSLNDTILEKDMKMFLRISLLVILLLGLISAHSYASSMIPELLCDLGLKFYQQGRYEEALHEFHKALIVNPNYAPALKYLAMIEQSGTPIEPEKYFIPPAFTLSGKSAAEAVGETMEIIELQREMIQAKAPVVKQAITPIPLPPEAKPVQEKKGFAKTLPLDQTFQALTKSIEIETGQSIILKGNNIAKFLVTQPDALTVEKRSSDELLVTGGNYGYTHLYVWDSQGRQEAEFITVPVKPKGPSAADIMRKEAIKARNFKLRYNMDWDSFDSGKNLHTLRRTSYSYAHDLSLIGQTPYGDFDSSVSVRSLATTTDITYLTFGLSNGEFGPFEGFSLRGFDFYPSFSNLAYSGATLRGGMFTSPAFNNKLSYSAFWGREGGGRYGNLSPGLLKTRNSFLEGLNLNYTPDKVQTHKFTLVHGWGRDRTPDLNRSAYDLSSDWNLGKTGLGYEVGYNSEDFAYLLHGRYSQNNIKLSGELRDINKKYTNITGNGWQQGQIGGLFNLDYQPWEKLQLSSSLDIYQDRLFAAEDKPSRLNEDFNFNANYQLSSSAALNLNYSLQNDLGKISQYRYQTVGMGGSKSFHFLTDIDTYLNFYHQESKNYNTHSLDYINDKIYPGVRVKLLGPLSAYANGEYNWLKEHNSQKSSFNPHAWEAGLDWSGQLAKNIPLSASWRGYYRQEKSAGGDLSFLSGNESIDSYSEVSFRPDNNKEIYGSFRAHKILKGKTDSAKRLDMSFNAGMRYNWDTGICWDSVGNIEGYIFKDLNSDGLRQRDEPPLAGVKVWLGKDKSQETDLFGYYCFKGVKGQKAYVSIDVTTFPMGFVLTVPQMQEVSLGSRHVSRVDFGLSTRSEVSGLIFEDVDGDGEYSLKDIGLRGAVLTLDGKEKTTTDSSGRYYFLNANTGGHTITVDLDSLPIYYLPKNALTKSFNLIEGTTYLYNIPLKRIKE